MTALGLVLAVVGFVLIVTEAHVPTLGALGIPGAVALVAGVALTVAGLGGGIAMVAIATVVFGLAAATGLAVVIPRAVHARQRRIRSGAQGLIGRVGVVRSWPEPATGQVLVDGALWRARLEPLALSAAAAGEQPAEDESVPALHVGDLVVVEHLNGLTLAVRRAEEWEKAS